MSPLTPFYIQQSWNKNNRVAIDPTQKVFSNIYFESGYHRARLVANDSVIATQPIHIISNGWEPHIYRSDSDPELIDLKHENTIVNGQFHIDKKILIKRGVDFNKRFHSRITNSQQCNVDSDNFTIATRMKADSVFHELCGWMDLVVVTEVNTLSVTLTQKGCENQAAYKLGEISKKGDRHDLSSLGCRLNDWQDVEIRVKDRSAEIFLNGKKLFSERYKEDFGKVVSLIFMFDGIGSIDYARLKNEKEVVVFEEEFD